MEPLFANPVKRSKILIGKLGAAEGYFLGEVAVARRAGSADVRLLSKPCQRHLAR